MQDEYFKSIEHAAAESRIVFSREYKQGRLGDSYSHLLFREVYGRTPPGGFSMFNTRGLNEKVKEYLSYSAQIHRKDFYVMDLGAGAGVAASQIRRLFPRCIIHTLGLTPFAPDMSLCMDHRGLTQTLAGLLKNDSAMFGLDWVDRQLRYYWGLYRWKVDPDIKKYSCFNVSDKILLLDEACERPWGVTFAAASAMADMGHKVFEPCECFAHRQYVGRLADEDIIFNDKYSLIYDDWGALHYSLKAAPEDQAYDIVEKVISALGPGGVFYASHIRTNKLKYFRALKDRSIETIINDEKSLSIKIVKGNAD